MKISIKATNIKLNPELREFIEEKINDLEKISSIFQKNEDLWKGKAKTKAWVEVGKLVLSHQTGPWHYAECQIELPGKSFRAVSEREDLKVAIVEVKDELERQLKKYKEKTREEFEKGAREMKEKLKISLSAKKPKRKGL